MKDTIFSPNFSLNFKGNLRVYKHPIVMGIINTTPDSFYTESRQTTEADILETVSTMIDEGVDIIDIGGYSSRPGADNISTEEELSRVLLPIKRIKSNFPDLIISIDTFRSEVAEQAIFSGADMINDISGGHADQNMLNIAAQYQSPICLMHMKGTPQNMQNKTDYNHLISDLIFYFSTQIKTARAIGISDIIIDPGLGFSKNLDQNYEVVNHLSQLAILDCPILVGASRKSMLTKLLDIRPDQALNATTAINVIALLNGSKILRVHDVKAAKEAVKIVSKTLSSSPSE